MQITASKQMVVAISLLALSTIALAYWIGGRHMESRLADTMNMLSCARVWTEGTCLRTLEDLNAVLAASPPMREEAVKKIEETVDELILAIVPWGQVASLACSEMQPASDDQTGDLILSWKLVTPELWDVLRKVAQRRRSLGWTYPSGRDHARVKWILDHFGSEPSSPP
jgi:hypothetical protein